MREDEARAALAAMDSANTNLADAMACPPWRHAAFGALMASLVLAVTVPPPWLVPIQIGSLAGMIWLLRHDRARFGVFVNGYRRGRTLWVTLGLLTAELGIVFLAMPTRHLPFPSPRGLACVAAAFMLATAASVLFQRVWIAEIREGQV